MNKTQVTLKIKPHGFSWEQFETWIKGEPQPYGDAYYEKDVDRFIYWMTKKRKSDKIR